MSEVKVARKLVAFDAAQYLDDEDAIAEYMTAVFEADDPDLLLLALGDVARARGMAQVAKDAGLGRESLYKALSPGAKPRFDTVLKVARALGVRFAAQPVEETVASRSNKSVQRTLDPPGRPLPRSPGRVKRR